MNKRFLFLWLILGSTSAFGENWPNWRGPTGNGVAPAAGFIADFSAEKGIAWKTELPGKGSSTPAVWEKHLYVTSEITPAQEQAGSNGLICYDLAGNEIWRATFGTVSEGKHKNGSGANPSPATDGKHIVAYFKSGDIGATDRNGKVLWQKNLQQLYGKDTLWWDLGTSPVIAGGNAIVAVMHEGESFLVALNLENGDVAWKESRNFVTKPESDQSYTTPVLIEQNGRQLLLVWGANHLTAHEADTGKEVWRCGGFNPDDKPMWRVIASPAVAGGIAAVPYARGKMIAGIKLEGSGDITETHRIWELDTMGTDVPTPIAVNGRLYLLTDKGHIHCLNLQDGNQHWEAKLPKHRNKYYASPLLAANQLICTREDGMIYTASVTDDGLTDITGHQMDERIAATPVAVNGNLIIRGEKHLFCIAKAP